jgi:porphobilinogen synthase
MQNAIRAIKVACPEMIVMPDVALDPIPYMVMTELCEGRYRERFNKCCLGKMAVSHARPVPILLRHQT